VVGRLSFFWSISLYLVLRLAGATRLFTQAQALIDVSASAPPPPNRHTDQANMPNDEAGMMVVEAGQVEERMEQDEEGNNPALDGSSSGLAPLTRPQYKPLPANEMEVRFRGRRAGGREAGRGG